MELGGFPSRSKKFFDLGTTTHNFQKAYQNAAFEKLAAGLLKAPMTDEEVWKKAQERLRGFVTLRKKVTASGTEYSISRAIPDSVTSVGEDIILGNGATAEQAMEAAFAVAEGEDRLCKCGSLESEHLSYNKVCPTPQEPFQIFEAAEGGKKE